MEYHQISISKFSMIRSLRNRERHTINGPQKEGVRLKGNFDKIATFEKRPFPFCVNFKVELSMRK